MAFGIHDHAAERAAAAIENDRRIPRAVQGRLHCGKPGAVGKFEIHNIRTGETRSAYSKFSGLQTHEGDVLSYYSPGGGGYGDPLERDPQKVLDDVLDGFIRPEHAAEYGVVLKEVDDGYGWALDLPATEAKRQELRDQSCPCLHKLPTFFDYVSDHEPALAGAQSEPFRVARSIKP